MSFKYCPMYGDYYYESNIWYLTKCPDKVACKHCKEKPAKHPSGCKCCYSCKMIYKPTTQKNLEIIQEFKDKYKKDMKISGE